ncbi:MAG: FAD-dependent oxidoreductase [Mycobacteriaceae bacterium]
MEIHGDARVAVVGAGPSGIYAVQALTDHPEVVGAVDVYDALPAPFGLVRYGVAPDHERIKTIVDTLRQVLERPGVRFLGNVRLGVDVSVDELAAHYDAVVVATGAATDRHLDVPGEDLDGSTSATDFVSWYSGHPDTEVERFTAVARAVAVIGAGNVALDVARMLLKPVETLRGTDVPEHVLDVLGASPLTDVHLLVRRGVAQVKFSPKELTEMGEIDGVDVLVDPADTELDPGDAEELAGSAVRARVVRTIQGWAQREPTGAPRRLHLHLHTRPVAVTGDDRVTGLIVERTQVRDGRVVGTGVQEHLEVQAVLRSVGYRGLPTDGLPFDDAAAVIPHERGAVLRDGVPVPRVYVTGWIKRGPTGVIGTNRRDATETVTRLLADLRAPADRGPTRSAEELLGLLAGRGVHPVDWAGWLSVDAAELVRGAPSGRDRVKIHERSEMLRVARGENGAPG